jgi:hypothetical protein
MFVHISNIDYSPLEAKISELVDVRPLRRRLTGGLSH